MPQASDSQRAKWGISEDKAEAYLYFHGWTHLDNWMWYHPLHSHTVAPLPRNDREALYFLQDEWDDGHIVAEYRVPRRRVDFFCEPFWDMVDRLKPIEEDTHEDDGEAAYMRQQERLMEEGPGPTLLEQQQAAYKIKHGLR